MIKEELRLRVGNADLCGCAWFPSLESLPEKTPWLVFLHEALGSIRLWRDVPQQLVAATGLPALVFERSGHGDSDPMKESRTAAYLHQEAWQVLPAVLDQCSIQKTILVGHSDGGSIALLFAAECPEKVVGIVSEAAHVFVEEETIQGIRAAGAAYAETNWREKLIRYHGAKTDVLFGAWQETWLAAEFRHWNIERFLPKITVPVLAIQGGKDTFGTRAQVAAIETQVAGPVRVLWVPDCGHEPHRQAADLVLAEIISFIQRVCT